MNLALQNRLAGLHKLSLYAVVAVGFLCVASGGGVGPVMGALFVVGMLASWYTDKIGFFDASSARWWNALILVFVAVTGVQVALTNVSVIDAAIRFVLLLALIKLFSRFSRRDDLQLYALSFLIFAAATAVNDGVTYGILFGMYVIAGTFSLALFHLTTELDEQHVSASAERTPFDRQYVLVLGAISLIIFASSLGIFFAFPRVGLGYFVTKTREKVTVKGLSDTVELGDHGKIRDNPEVVMHVEFPDGRPANYKSLHWRTMTFDHYDGTDWSRTWNESERLLPRSGSHYEVSRVHPEWHQGLSRAVRPEKVEIYLEPLGIDILPRLWPIGDVRFGSDDLRVPWNPRSGNVTIDAYGDLHHTVRSQVGLAYTLSVLGKPRVDELRTQQFDARHRGPDPHYLQLPKMSKRFLHLAGEVTAGAGTPYEKAEAIVDYLQKNYHYTTDLPAVQGDNPIESFVFDTKRGHCEYFATTAILMLRAAGVPARLVNGFLGGRWNGVGNYLAVRQGDAHAWVELYVPHFGWAPIDPTPAIDVIPTEPSPLVAWYRNTYDDLRLNWMKWVIEYDLQSQIEMAKKLGRFLSPKGSGLSHDSTGDQGDEASSPHDWRPYLMWLGLVVGFGLGVWRSRSAIGRRSRLRVVLMVLVWPPAMALWLMWFEGFTAAWGIGGAAVGLGSVGLGIVLGSLSRHAHRSRLAQLFARVEQAGAGAGHPRRRDEGPGAYLRRLGEAFPAASRDLAAFRQRYLAARFGGREPGLKQMDGLRDLVRAIRKTMRRASR